MIRIHVTAEDIDLGDPGSCFTCAIALAIRRRFMEAGSIEVSPVGIYVDRQRATVPTNALAWMTLFDAEGPAAVDPFTFEMDLQPRGN
jgi:hypothetical protein